MLRRHLVTAAVAVAALASPASALADSACAISPAFQKVDGDQLNYMPAIGGTFEKSEGYSISGGAFRVPAMNETAFINGLGAYSLSLPAGGSVTLPFACPETVVPTARFFTLGASGSSVRVEYQLDGGSAKWSPVVATVAAGTKWTATGLLSWTQPTNVKVTGIRITGVTGITLIDDVMVDPLKRK